MILYLYRQCPIHIDTDSVLFVLIHVYNGHVLYAFNMHTVSNIYPFMHVFSVQYVLIHAYSVNLY